MCCRTSCEYFTVSSPRVYIHTNVSMQTFNAYMHRRRREARRRARAEAMGGFGAVLCYDVQKLLQLKSRYHSVCPLEEAATSSSLSSSSLADDRRSVWRGYDMDLQLIHTCVFIVG